MQTCVVLYVYIYSSLCMFIFENTTGILIPLFNVVCAKSGLAKNVTSEHILTFAQSLYIYIFSHIPSRIQTQTMRAKNISTSNTIRHMYVLTKTCKKNTRDPCHIAPSKKNRQGKLIWFAWMSRGYVDKETIARWRFDGDLESKRGILSEGGFRDMIQKYQSKKIWLSTPPVEKGPETHMWVPMFS